MGLTLFGLLFANGADQVGNFLILGKPLPQVRQYQIAFFVAARSQELARFRDVLLPALSEFGIAGRFQQLRDLGFTRKFLLQTGQQDDALVAAPPGQQPPRLSQTLEPALTRLVCVNLVHEGRDFIVGGKLFLDLMEQSRGFLMPASRQQASCLFQALPPPLFGLLFARGLEQPEDLFLARELALQFAQKLNAVRIILQRPQTACLPHRVQKTNAAVASRFFLYYLLPQGRG